ncbi:MAG: hypothetical protein QOI83_1289, partial [Streptomycetaceae bacterium]|nr:hypothetical protein [Streptomycetaceae bacterium]
RGSVPSAGGAALSSNAGRAGFALLGRHGSAPSAGRAAPPAFGRGRCPHKRRTGSSGLARAGSSPAGTPRRVPSQPHGRVTAARGGDRKTNAPHPVVWTPREHAPQGAEPGRRGRCRGVPADCVAQVPVAMAHRSPGPGTQSWGHLPAEGWWGHLPAEGWGRESPRRRHRPNRQHSAPRPTAQGTKTQPVRRLRTERQPRGRAKARPVPHAVARA